MMWKQQRSPMDQLDLPSCYAEDVVGYGDFMVIGNCSKLSSVSKTKVLGKPLGRLLEEVRSAIPRLSGSKSSHSRE